MQLIERLTRFDAGGHWVVSCYLKLEPRDRTRGKYLIKLKNRMRDALDAFAAREGDRGRREAVERDLERIRGHLERPGHLPASQGVALFACGPRNLFEAVPLPQVYRSRLAIDRTPLVRELAAAADEFGTVLVAVHDRTSARFFGVTAFEIEEFPSLPGDATRPGRFHGSSNIPGPGKGVAASGEYNYNQRIRVEKQRHYAMVADRLFDLSRGREVRAILLGGVGRDAEAVRTHLHPYLLERYAGALRLNPKEMAPADLTAPVADALREHRRTVEGVLLRELLEALGTGWAVNGLEGTLRALSRGQIRTLLVDPGAEAGGFRCGDSGRLTSAAAGCRGEGEPAPVLDLVDEAIEEALRQRSHVAVIETQPARHRVDGLAAMLRFKQG